MEKIESIKTRLFEKIFFNLSNYFTYRINDIYLYKLIYWQFSRIVVIQDMLKDTTEGSNQKPSIRKRNRHRIAKSKRRYNGPQYTTDRTTRNEDKVCVLGG